MNQLTEKLDERIVQLKEVIQEKKQELKKVPKGIINTAQKGNRIQYYYKMDSADKVRKYIKKDNEQLIKGLCQRDYDERVIALAEKELKRLEKFRNYYKNDTYESVYDKLVPNRKNHVVPVELSDEDFISEWLNIDYLKKGFREDTPEYYTDNEERVRSKSEILIANALKKHNIPYRYEAPLYLNGYGNIHPDFTVLNTRERKEYYWEHLGKMDEPEYIEQALQRISAYEKNDIFPGDNLILSHETLKYPINLRNIEKIIFKYLK